MTKEEAIKYLQQLYPNGGHCCLDEQRIEAVGMAVKALQEEPVSDDLEDFATHYADGHYMDFAEQGDEDYWKTYYACIASANWQKSNLWKPANGDDLPEYEREVVAFQEIFPTDVDVPSLLKIVIAHRPNPDGWDGKSLSTGKVEHYTPKIYDKGGWNIPDVKFWLDVELPKEIEL